MRREVAYLGLVLTSSLWANIADLNFSYQDYIDFGNNKGRFTPGSKNIYLVSKNGERLKFGPEIYMPNFAGSTNSPWGGLGGTHTYVGGSYFYTAAHVLTNVLGYSHVAAGLIVYNVASGKNYAEVTPVANGDVAFVRMSKFVTSLTPCYDTIEINAPIDSNRYTQAWRSGMGYVGFRHSDGSVTSNVIGHDVIRTGGRLRVEGTSITELKKIGFGGPNGLLFSDVVTSGDSGSPLFLWDSVDKVWKLAGALSSGDGRNTSQYSPYWGNILTDLKKRYTNPDIKLFGQNLVWSKGKMGENIAEDDKDIFLYGGGTVRLGGDIDQQSGGIYFDANQTYTIAGGNGGTPHSWVGGGLDIAEGTVVHWVVDGKIGDALHKIGKGILSVELANSGELNLGDGLAILETSQKAFSRIMITSGRPTLKAGEKYLQEIATSDVLFLTYGGTFDLNGKDLKGDVVYATDSGARLVNTNASILSNVVLGQSLAATTNITNNSQEKNKFIFHGEIGNGIVIQSATLDNLIFDGNIVNPRGQIQFKNGRLSLQGHPVVHAYIDNSDGKTLAQLQKITGENNLYTAPTKIDQEDWEQRVFILDEIVVTKENKDTTLTLGRDALVFSDIYANGASVYFGGNQDVFIDKYDGENIANQNLDSSKGNAFVFQQEITAGKNRKDNSFQFEGSIVGIDSDFYIANTSSNPLQFGRFEGVDRNNINQTKDVDYKVSLNSGSSFKANYVVLHGGGEDKILMDFVNGQKNTEKTGIQDRNVISHLILVGENTSEIYGDLSINANFDLSSDNSSSIHFTNAQSLLESKGGTLRLGSDTKLIFDGSLDIFRLKYDQKIPLIRADVLDDQRSSSKIVISDISLNALNFQNYSSNQGSELGLILLRYDTPISLPSVFSDNLMLKSLSQTNHMNEEVFYEVALDTLMMQAAQGRYMSSLEKTIEDAQNIIKDLSDISYSYFSFNNLAINNYSKNSKLYLENRRESRGNKKRLEIDEQNNKNQADENIDIADDTYKSNNLWMIVGGGFASNNANTSYGGELRGGYDGILSDNSSFFSSLGFSINYTYTYANQNIVDSSLHGVYVGLHNIDVIDNTHEILTSIYGGVQLGDSASKINEIGDTVWVNTPSNQSGFLLNNTASYFCNFLIDAQLFYKYIFTLDDSLEDIQQLKPIVGIDYLYLINQEKNIDIFKINAANISIPIMKIGLEYDYISDRQIHSLSIFGNYNLNYPQTNGQDGAYVGTSRYTDEDYTSTQLFEASISVLYSWDIELYETFSIDCALKGEYFFGSKTKTNDEWFSISGNMGVNWKF